MNGQSGLAGDTAGARGVLGTLSAAAAIAAAMMLASGSAFAQDGWAQDGSTAAMFRGGAELTGVYWQPAPRRLVGVRFAVQTGGPIRATPTIADGVLYLASTDGLLYAVDALTGEERWRFQAGGPISATPTVIDGAVFFTGRDETLYALSASDGRRLWSLDLGPALGEQDYWDFYTSSPTAHDDRVYVGSGSGRMLAVIRASGRIDWSVDIGSRVRATPAVTDREVVFGAMDGHLYSLDRATGAQRWRFATKGASNTFATRNNDTTSLFASPTIADGIVTVGGRDGMLYGVDLETGTQRWVTTHDGESWILATSAADGVVYASSGSASLIQAADLTTGAERWRMPTDDGVFSTVSVAGDVLLFIDTTGLLRALDRTDARELWRFRLGGRSLSTPAVAGGVVYGASDDGVLYALDVSAVDASPVVAPARRLVFAGGRSADADDIYFERGVGAANLSRFRAAGYEPVDASQLMAAMEAQAADPDLNTVVVFPDDQWPAAGATPASPEAPLRRYLQAGGKVVFLGVNPVLYAREPGTAQITRRDPSLPLEILNLRYPARNRDNGYHISHVTEEGRRWGLDGRFIAAQPITTDQVDTVLSLDEFGLATEWVKDYGSNGGAVLQLVLPDRIADLQGVLRAIDHLVARHHPGPE